ncbi:MAG: hypothetical protein EOP45_14205 [Sphingobacteriaceae bacterium]|nr:MAG: hypothetical protein EOP45_14205 [Sphingobacteriaceae bacterium]
MDTSTTANHNSAHIKACMIDLSSMMNEIENKIEKQDEPLKTKNQISWKAWIEAYIEELSDLSDQM